MTWRQKDWIWAPSACNISIALDQTPAELIWRKGTAGRNSGKHWEVFYLPLQQWAQWDLFIISVHVNCLWILHNKVIQIQNVQPRNLKAIWKNKVFSLGLLEVFVLMCSCTIISLPQYGLVLIVFVYLIWSLLEEGRRKQACSGFFFMKHHINISDSDPALFITAHIRILW